MHRIGFYNVGLEIHGRNLLEQISLEIVEGENWVVYGPNGSGKSLLGRILAGRLSPSSGSIVSEGWPGYPESLGYVSFELMESVLEEERKTDETWFHHGDVDPGRSPRNLFAEGAAGDPEGLDRLISLFGISHILDRGLKFLSTGELRKVLLVDALRKGLSLVVLDEPFDGLDSSARDHLAGIIDLLAEEGTGFVLILGRYDEIPRSADKLLVLDRGRTAYLGTLSAAPAGGFTGGGAPVDPEWSSPHSPSPDAPPSPGGEILRLEEVSVSYGETPVLTGLNWRVRWGEQWMIHGPNGAGK